MPATTLTDLLERNARHTDELAPDHFDAVQDEQWPAAVSMCCADSRVSQEGMWDVREPGWLFPTSTIGNQVWDVHEGERVVDGSFLYPVTEMETDVAIIVGHTGCGAVTAALKATRGHFEAPASISKWIELLCPVVEHGLADERVDEDADNVVDQLVEYNVDRQIQFLRESEDVPADQRLFGFVYDFQGVYGEPRGRAYLVNVDGETDVGELRATVPDRFEDHVDRLLQE